MKLFLPVLAVCVTVAFGVQPQEIGDIFIGGANPEPSDDLVYAQTYDHDILVSGWAWGQICDDFKLSSGAYVDKVVVWICSVDWNLNPMPPPDYLDIAFIQDTGDDDPNTATAVWSGTTATTSIDTGDGFAGGTMPIYATTCIFPEYEYVHLTGGVRYWLVVTQYYEYWRFYSCVLKQTYYTQSWLNSGAPPWETGYDTFGYEADMFYELYGMTQSALENSTWGNIKSVF